MGSMVECKDDIRSWWVCLYRGNEMLNIFWWEISVQRRRNWWWMACWQNGGEERKFVPEGYWRGNWKGSDILYFLATKRRHGESDNGYGMTSYLGHFCHPDKRGDPYGWPCMNVVIWKCLFQFLVHECDKLIGFIWSLTCLFPQFWRMMTDWWRVIR